MEDELHSGKILFYRAEGWGFLQDMASGTHYFYHVTGLTDSFLPSTRDTVSFKLATSSKNKGLIAVKVKQIE